MAVSIDPLLQSTRTQVPIEDDDYLLFLGVLTKLVENSPTRTMQGSTIRSTYTTPSTPETHTCRSSITITFNYHYFI